MGLRLLRPGPTLGLGRVGESGERCASQTWGRLVVPIMYLMVSKKLSDGDRNLNTYGIFDAFKSYEVSGCRVCWASAPALRLALVKRWRHTTSWSLISISTSL